MALKDTINNMRKLLTHITTDLEKSDNGNKAASQRVRTGTVKLEKVAKLYRKESIKHEKSTKGQKRTTKKSVVAKSKAKPAPKQKPKTKAKASHKASSSRARAFSFKKPTAKLPTRRAFR